MPLWLLRLRLLLRPCSARRCEARRCPSERPLARLVVQLHPHRAKLLPDQVGPGKVRRLAAAAALALVELAVYGTPGRARIFVARASVAVLRPVGHLVIATASGAVATTAVCRFARPVSPSIASTIIVSATIVSAIIAAMIISGAITAVTSRRAAARASPNSIWASTAAACTPFGAARPASLPSTAGVA